MNVSVMIPRQLASHLSEKDPQSIKAWVIETALNAINAGIEPLFIDTAHPDNYNLKMYLRQSFLSAIPRIEGRTIPATVTALVNGWVKHRHNEEAEKQPKVNWDGMRPEQIRLIEQSESGINENGIVLAEAGTGVGKSRAALVIAARYVDKTGKNAVMAVPTIAVLSQVIDELRHLDFIAMGLKESPKIGYVIGKGAFVDPSKLTTLLETEPDEEDVRLEEETKTKLRQWMNSGAGFVAGAKTGPLHQIGNGIGWLVEDLQQIAPEIPASELRMTEDSSEENTSVSAYQAIRELALSCQIVVCTHAMLGIAVLRSERSIESTQRRITDLELVIGRLKEKNQLLSLNRAEKELKESRNLLNQITQEEKDAPELTGKILPNYGLLIVDEAHQMEASIASLRRSELSPRNLAKEIMDEMPLFAECKQKTLAEKLITVLKKLHTDLTLSGMKNRKLDRLVLGGENKEGQESILNDLKEIMAINPQKAWVKCPSVRKLLISMSTVAKNATSNGKRDAVYVNFSPTRRYPTIFTGPNTIRRLMERIWDNAEAAILLSATLTVPDKNGIPRSEFIIRQLAIPTSRLKTPPPITQPWLYDPLLIKTGKGRNDLVPPSDMGQESENKEANERANCWAAAIAAEIANAHETGKGGLLGLTSSYQRVAMINDCLRKIIKDPEIIVHQSRKKGIRFAQAEFESKSKKGIRPIWVSTGGAWTGLDIRGEGSASDDFLLTDNVIINIPFGTNRSTTHQQRVDYSSIAERDRAALEFKQGIGRLMRRGGVSDRRLHILDPRVWDEAAFYIPFRKMLENYKSEPIKVPREKTQTKNISRGKKESKATNSGAKIEN